MGAGNIAPNGSEMYNMGGGGEIGLEIDFSTIWPNPIGLGYTLGIEGGLLVNPFRGDTDKNISLYSAGGSLGLYFFPLSRLFTRIDGTVGVYQAAILDMDGNTSISMPGLYLRYGGEIGFRFTPGFTIAANAGWKQYEDQNRRLLNSGMYTGLTLQMTFHAGRGSSEGVGAVLEQHGAVFPAFMQVYQKTAIGDVVIRNFENAEIRDVRLSFRAGRYTTSEFPCGSVSYIPRGRSVQLPLLADFSSEILRFTDSGRIMGELVIRYKLLGQERETVRAVTVATHNRNMISPPLSQTSSVLQLSTDHQQSPDSRPLEDSSALAAFISPTSPEVLDFARFIAGLERNGRRIGHNQKLSYAIWLLEGLKASGIRLRTVSDESQTNSVQFPSETLLFRTGSSRDLALLFAACLEGVGIDSAFISIDGDLLVAVSLSAGANQAETLFNGTDKILIVDDNIWLPLSLSSLNEGFTACWTQGTARLNQTFREGKQAEFVIVSEAWATYPPALFPELGRNNIRTDTDAATREVNRAFQRYIELEINPLIRTVTGGQRPLTEAARQNRLAILYMRAGRIAEGKASYERAAGLGSVPAMTNRGNLALIEREFAVAERWFRQALQREPQNRAALRGLERVSTGR